MGTLEHVRKKKDELVPNKFCTRCQKEKQREGGRQVPTGNGRRIWKCAECIKQARLGRLAILARLK